jgi:hypothetical protein
MQEKEINSEKKPGIELFTFIKYPLRVKRRYQE